MIDTAIIGAGPYGLSIAAHLRSRGLHYRIFGRPMDSWLNHMPAGMMLKSDGFASNIYDAEGRFTLKAFCQDRGIPYLDSGGPVKLETFAAYGLAFQRRNLPDLTEANLVSIQCAPRGFFLRFDNGEEVDALRVVLAIGITSFKYMPPVLAPLSSDFATHSYDHADPAALRGKSVVVVGGGASAIGLATLMKDADVDVSLIARAPHLEYHNGPTEKRPMWQRLRHPSSGLGPGLRSRFFSEAPHLFRRLPDTLRVELVRRSLGPSGGWYGKEKMANVPQYLGCDIQTAKVSGNKVHLTLSHASRGVNHLVVDHVIAATGYRVNLNQVSFLDPYLRSKLKLTAGSPSLSNTLESSVRGIYFAGLAAANSFGPVMRFAYGARFASTRLEQALAKEQVTDRPAFAVTRVPTYTK